MRLFKNGHVVDPANKRDEVLDILVQDGIIARIGKHISLADAEIVDINGYVITPGLIDMHVHLREPGREDKETISTGTGAAALGGITGVASMPNTSPPADDTSVIHYILAKAKEAGYAKVYPIGAISKGRKGEELTEMGKLIEAGARGFSDDGQSVESSELMRRALEYTSMLGSPVIAHCEDPTLGAGGVMHEGYYSTMLGLRGIPAASEEIMIMRDIALAELTGGHVHIAHVSTKKSVDIIKAAKQKGIKVTAEVTPHHLLLSHELLVNYDPNFKVNPPLRTKEECQALLQGLADGTLDAIASDHAPHTPEEKEVEFDLSPFGISGVETMTQLILSELVVKKLLPLKQFVLALSTKPAAILGIKGGSITEGNPADLTILDLKRHWTINKHELLSKGKNTPFHGYKGVGLPIMTVVNGEVVMSDRHLAEKQQTHRSISAHIQVLVKSS